MLNDHMLAAAFERDRARKRDGAYVAPLMLLVDAADIVRALRVSDAGLKDAIAKAALRIDRIYDRHNLDTLKIADARRCTCRAPRTDDDWSMIGDIAESAGWGIRYRATCESTRYAIAFHALEHMCIARSWDFATVVCNGGIP